MSIIRGAMVLAIRRGGASISVDDLRDAVGAYALRVSFLDRNPFA
ncbi:hypothetical protein ACFSC3_08275 [Sphingomonas floccifaciens]|uniref:Uncharacterized protein n=1 Tax=Sphingomonas floccifaciens TaxID=1844115 RepID=A0ABW4NFK0_9SPHN